MNANDSYDKAKAALVGMFRDVYLRANIPFAEARQAEVEGVVDDLLEGIENDFVRDLDARVEELERTIAKLREI